MAYSDEGPPLLFMFAHGGIAIFVYITFYLNIFGRDAVQVMFTNAALGLLASMPRSAGFWNCGARTSVTTPGIATSRPFFTTCCTPSCCGRWWWT
jgi:hypothetical protein